LSIPPEVMKLENRSIGLGGEQTLVPAFDQLLACWRSGDRDREVGLHLMFLAWYLRVEPPFLTGCNEAAIPWQTLVNTFEEVHDHFGPVIRGDAEMLFCVALMAHLDTWCFRDEALWASRSKEYQKVCRLLCPTGLDPAIFSGRGAFGAYFAGHARSAAVLGEHYWNT
jgi:hypothetical protein